MRCRTTILLPALLLLGLTSPRPARSEGGELLICSGNKVYVVDSAFGRNWGVFVGWDQTIITAATGVHYGTGFDGAGKAVYVADAPNSDVIYCNDLDGHYIDIFADGWPVTQAPGPYDFVFGADGSLYAPFGSGQYGDCVVRFGRNGLGDKFVQSNSGGLSEPRGITFGPDGNLYVASTGSHQILRYDGATGAFIDAFVTGDSTFSPRQISFGPDGHLYAPDAVNSQVLKYDGLTGAPKGVFVAPHSGGADMTVGMAFGPDGNLYLASQNTGQILRYNLRTGAFMGVFSQGYIGQPTYIAFEYNPAITNFKLSAAVVTGSVAVTGGLVLQSKAPPGGALVRLRSTNPNVQLPATVTVPAGAFSVSFNIPTTSVSAVQSGQLSAFYLGKTINRSITVRPIGVKSFTLSSGAVTGGNSVDATVTLEAPAGPGPINVTLTSSSTKAVPTPSSIVIPAGSKSATFSLLTKKVTSAVTVKIRAAANGTGVVAALTVNP